VDKLSLQDARRVEEQEPEHAEPSWLAQVQELEAAGIALSVEALHRANRNAIAAEVWLQSVWRLRPDEWERAVRAEAIAHVRASTPHVASLRVRQASPVRGEAMERGRVVPPSIPGRIPYAVRGRAA
jgi:hypothetical protein